MPCRSARELGLPFDGIVCFGREPRRRCARCGALGAEHQCDYPAPHRKSTTCDRRLCRRCRVVAGDDVDYCPEHGWRPGDPPPRVPVQESQL